MPGLLDLFGGDNPQTQGLLAAAAGILNASGPSLMPRSLGQVMGAGIGGYQQGQQSAAEQEMLRQRMKLLELQEQREQQKLDLQKQVMSRFTGGGVSPGASAALAQGATVGDIGPTVTNAQRMAQAPAPSTGAEIGDLDTLRAMAIAGIPGAKELFDIHKYQHEPQKLEAGSTYVDRATGKQRYMPKLDNGFTIDSNGAASMLPGYVDGTAALEGAKANATEEAKAKYGTTVLNLPGGPRMVSNAELPDVLSGGWGNVNKQYNQGKSQRNSDQLAILNDEYARTTNPKDRAAIAREIVNAGGRVPQGGPGVALQDPVEQEARMRGVQVNSDLDKTKRLGDQSAQKLYGQIGAVIPQARSLLRQDPTGSGAGALVDSTLGFFGRTTDSGIAADKLSTIGGWLTSNVPRMEGPQSDADRKNYAEMAGRIGDRTLPVQARLANLDALEKLVGAYANANGLKAPGAQEQPSAQRKVATLSDIAATAKASGRSTAEVTAALRAKGYIIGGQ
jgi:hypothetical protein